MPLASLAAPPDLAEQIAAFEADHALYCEVALRILTKDEGLQPLLLNDSQAVVEARLDRQLAETGRVRALVLKARQEGISTGVAARFTKKTTLFGSLNAKVVADADERGGEIFGIYERFYDHLPAEVKPPKRSTRKGQVLHFARPWDAKITVRSAKDKEAGRAAVIHLLHASEFGFWDYPAETLLSLMQAVPKGRSGSEAIIESTANGVGNAFHVMWEMAESGESGWIAIFLPWLVHREYRLELAEGQAAAILGSLDEWEREAYEVGIPFDRRLFDGVEETVLVRLDLEQIEWRRVTIRDECGGDLIKFCQEYPSTAEEAFIVSGAQFFDGPKLAQVRKRCTDPIRRVQLVESEGSIFMQKDPRGWLRIWDMPETGAHYVVGADTAEGKLVAARQASFDDPDHERGGRDFCSADVIRIGYTAEVAGQKVWVPPKQVAHLHGRMAPEVFAHQLYLLSMLYSCPHREGERDIGQAALTAVERNHSSGQTVLQRLRHTHEHPNLYWHRKLNVRQEKVTAELGWVTSAQTRRPMLDELSAAVRNDEVEIPNKETIKEMLTFVMADDGQPEAQEECHDDRVISLGIAYQMIGEHVAPSASEPNKPVVRDSPTGR